MNINSVANSIYRQYQNTLNGLKDGSVSYQDDLETHQNLSSQARGLSVFVGATGESLQRVKMPPEVMERIQSVLANSHSVSPGSAAQAYRNAGGEQLEQETAAQAEKRHALSQNAGWGMKDVRGPFNAEAHGYLAGYASTHKADWEATAQDLGISIGGGGALSQFYDPPVDSGLDISVGVAKSNAEKIFRKIASADEIADFEQHMAPFQKDMEQAMTDKLTRVRTH